MPRYTIFGLRLDSEIEFPELAPAAGDGPPAKFRLADPAPPSPQTRWVHEAARDDGAPWLSVGPAGHRTLLRFHGQADFLAACGTLDIEARPAPGASIEAVRWLFLDHVLPRALAASGRPVLHASAVETERGALVFVGESGSGKSTLAASFCAAGARLLSDDGVLIESGAVVPNYPVHRLWSSGVAVLGGATAGDPKKKHRLAPAPVVWNPSPAPLRRIFSLAPFRPGRPWIEPACGGEAMLLLVRQAFRLDPADRALAAAEFRVLGDLAASFPPLILAFPRGPRELAEAQIKISEFS